MKTIQSIWEFGRNDVAQFRLKVIRFHAEHGTQATRDAFGISKPTIYRWKQKLNKSGGRLSSLIPESTTPHTVRQMQTHPQVLAFIRDVRQKHPHLGKEKIKPLLDEYCRQREISSLSESTVGKVIKRYGMLVPKKNGRYYHNPADKRAQKKHSYKTKVKRSPTPSSFGYVEIDTTAKFINGMKLYIFNAIDIKLKFEFAYAYSRLNSSNGKDFFQKLESVYPLLGGIHIVQTDNGLEFMGEFCQYLKEKSIKHLFIYPRCPKINSFIERSNRSLKEEFINHNLDYALEDITAFNSRLMDHLIWYNTKRVHKSLNKQSPIDFLLSVCPESHKWVTYT